MLVPPLTTRYSTAIIAWSLLVYGSNSKKYTNTTCATKCNVQALLSAETSQRFNNELTCLLGDLDSSEDINKHWNNIKSSLYIAAEKILGEPKNQNKPGISHETLALIDKRRQVRLS